MHLYNVASCGLTIVIISKDNIRVHSTLVINNER